MIRHRPALGLIAGLGVTQIISWGSLYYAIGVVGPVMVAEGRLASSVVYGGYSLSLLVSGLSAPLSGRAIDWFGGSRVMSLGSIAAALALALMAFSTSAVPFLLASVVAGVAISMTLYEAAFATLVGLTRHRGSDAIAALTLIGGFASTVFWPLTQALQTMTGWRETYLIYAASHLLVCLPIHALALRPARDAQVHERDDAAAGAEALPTLTSRERRITLLLITAMAVATNFASSGLTVHFVPLLVGIGLSGAAAVAIGTLFGPGQVAGRILSLTVGRQLSALATGVWSTALFPLSFAFLLGGAKVVTAGAFAILVGGANGVLTIARGTIPLAFFGRTGFGALLGAIALPSVIARAAAPLAFARAIEATGVLGGFVLAIVSGLLAFGAVAALALFSRRFRGMERESRQGG